MTRWRALCKRSLTASTFLSLIHISFDLDKLINRRSRPGFNEACEMYEVAVPDDALTEEYEYILNYDDIDDPDAFA